MTLLALDPGSTELIRDVQSWDPQHVRVEAAGRLTIREE